MTPHHAIHALTALARSASLDETLPLLERARASLGPEADAFRPLLESLTLRVQEVAELRRRLRALHTEARSRRSTPPDMPLARDSLTPPALPARLSSLPPPAR